MKRNEIEAQEKKNEDIAIKYSPISEDAKYDRKTFVSSQKDLQKLEEKFEELNNKDATLGQKRDARQDACKIIFRNPGAALGTLPEQQIYDLHESSISLGRKSMAKFAQNNLDALLDILENEKDGGPLVDLINSVNILNTKGEDKDHDYFANIINEQRLIGEIARKAGEGDLKNMAEYVSKKIDKKKVSEGTKALMAQLASSREGLQVAFQSMAEAQGKLMKGVLYDKDKKPEVKRIRNMFKRSLKVVKEQIDKEKTDEGAKSDMYDHYTLPAYMTVARLAYKIEKRELEADDSKKVDEKKRKIERGEYGLSD